MIPSKAMFTRLPGEGRSRRWAPQQKSIVCKTAQKDNAPEKVLCYTKAILRKDPITEVTSMYKQILSFLLCIVMILSFSVVSFAEDDRIPEAGDHIFFGHYEQDNDCLLYTSPSPRDKRQSRMPSSA